MSGNPAPRRLLRTFGTVEMRQDGHPVKFRTRKTLSMAAFLGLQKNARVHRDTLATLFWPDAAPDAARQSVRMALSDLRSVLGADALESERDYARLCDEALTSDAEQFELGLAAPTHEAAYGLLKPELAQVSGPPLQNVDEDWASAERFRLEELLAQASCRFMEACGALQKFGEGIDQGKRTLGHLGCREDVHIGLMKLYVANGATSLALAQFEELEKQLDELWGEPPSAAASEALNALPRTAEAPMAKPQRLTKALIGRDAFVDRLCARFDPSQPSGLVTVVGVGGCGKTSVALMAMERLAPAYASRAWFVDLSAETSGDGAIRAVQTALGLPIGDAGEALFAVARALDVAPSVVVLDNCEQLIAGGVEWIAKLVQAAPQARFLATSRMSLKLSAETLEALEPLEIPGPRATLETLRQNPSVALFERDAKAVRPNFRISADNAAAVVELCRRLDGIPLALTLAAARMTAISPAQALASIQRSLSVLTNRTADAPERHASLNRSIEWSVNLLSTPARDAALAASLIRGSFSCDELALVAEVHEAEPLADELCEALILNANIEGETAGYTFLETIRHYLREQAQSDARFPIWSRRRLNAYLHKGQRIHSNPRLNASQRTRALLGDYENYLESLEFALDDPESFPLVAQLIDVIPELNQARNFGGVVGERLNTFLSGPAEKLPPNDIARIGVAVVRFQANVQQPEVSAEILRRAESLADDTDLLADVYFQQGALAKSSGDYAFAIDRFEKCGAVAVKNRRPLRAMCDYNLGLTYACLGDMQKSLEQLLKGLESARLADNPANLIRNLFDAGSELANQGRGDEALPLLHEAIELSQQIDSRKLEGLSRWQMGDAQLSLGQPVEALLSLARSIHQTREGGFFAAINWIFVKTAQALATNGFVELAAKFLGKGRETRVADGRPLGAYEQEPFDKAADLAKADLGAARYERHYGQGANAHWDDLIAELDAVVATLEAPK